MQYKSRIRKPIQISMLVKIIIDKKATQKFVNFATTTSKQKSLYNQKKYPSLTKLFLSFLKMKEIPSANSPGPKCCPEFPGVCSDHCTSL